MKKRIFICPNNDLEAKAIIELLEKNGEDYIVTSQGWGASWEMLEPEVFEELKVRGFKIEDEYIEYLKEYDQKIADIDSEILRLNNKLDKTKASNSIRTKINKEITILEKSKAEFLEKRKKIASEFLFSINRQASEASISMYGIELKGSSRGAIDIDHHDDRSGEKSSIEQVADILEVELDIDEQFIAANDRGVIPEMEKLGAALGLSEEDLKAIITNVRMRDRQNQGITLEDEVEAERTVRELGDLSEKRDYILIDQLAHSKTSTITDRLYGKYDNLLIVSENGETNFFGSTEIIDALEARFRIEDPKTGESKNTWKGGQLEQGTGYWGGYADQESIKQVVQEMIDKKRKEEKEKEAIKQFWIKKYSEDKIGTVAKLSQAMQHGAWLREWQRIHGNEPRIKPITQKVNGEKVKIGESDIAVPWSELHTFFRHGNEYGDIETVKFLSERIENGDISNLTVDELYRLSERENVKWSDGVHSLNPFQGYLYDFVDRNSYILETACGEEDYGEFYPLEDFKFYMSMKGEPSKSDRMYDVRHMNYEQGDYGDPDYEEMYDDGGELLLIEMEEEKARLAFSRYYTTRLLQQVIKETKNSKYKDFVNFDITSVVTEEQIEELDRKLIEMINSEEIGQYLEELNGNADYEAKLYASLRREVSIEIKKDSDRIENAHKVFVALETGDMDTLLEDPETARWAREVYEEETRGKSEEISD